MVPLKKIGFYRWVAGREAAPDFRSVQVSEPFNTKRNHESQNRTQINPPNPHPHPPGLTVPSRMFPDVLCFCFSFKYHCCEWMSFYHLGGKTGLVRAYLPVAVPTDGTPQILAWRRGPQQPGTAGGTWSTADQPDWKGSGSTCTGTPLHLEGEKSLIIHCNTETAPLHVKLMIICEFFSPRVFLSCCFD